MKARLSTLLVGLSVALLLAAIGIWIFLPPHVPSKYQPIDMESIGSFPFDDTKGTLNDIPVAVRQLDGRRVSIRGMMIPMDGRDDRINQFVIVPHMDALNGTPNSITQTVVAQMPLGKATQYIERELYAEGTLHVSVAKQDGSPYSLFTIDVDRVVPAPPQVRPSWLPIVAGGVGGLALLAWLAALRHREDSSVGTT